MPERAKHLLCLARKSGEGGVHHERSQSRDRRSATVLCERRAHAGSATLEGGRTSTRSARGGFASRWDEAPGYSVR